MIRKLRRAEVCLENLKLLVTSVSEIVHELEMPLIRAFILYHLFRSLFR